MAIETTQQPYEFLVRWNLGGTINGAHVQWRYVMTDGDGNVVGESLSSAQPVALSEDQDGYPLSDILTTVQQTALADVDVLRSELSAMTAERDAAIRDRDQKTTTLTERVQSLMGENMEMKAKLAALETS